MTGIMTVVAPSEFANSQLNGAECVIVAGPAEVFPNAVEVLLLDGPQAHLSWWISRAHLTARTPLTDTGEDQ